MSGKNCPETTRQKMINMMYLVLTAMLALNVSAEVLQSFRVIDASLSQTLNNVKGKNDQIYNSFEAAFIQNPAKVKGWKDKADQVKEKTNALVTKIKDLKEELVVASGGVPKSNAAALGIILSNDDPIVVSSKGDTILIRKEDDLNTPSEIMITKKKGTDLKNSIEGYRDFMSTFLPEGAARENFVKQLDTSDPKVKLTEGGEKKTWEIMNFESKPLIAVITLLSKMQIDVQNAETNIISTLYSQIDAASFKFNKLGARILPKSTYVLKGDQFEAEIYLAAEDTTQQPEIIVNGSKLVMREGKGVYKASASEIGTFKWKGIINFKNPEGNVVAYPFAGEYQVGEPSATISPQKMNVLYVGLANPISVSVAGVASENIEITFNNGRFEKSGNEWLVYPSKLDVTGKNTRISVVANMNGEKRPMGFKDFRVKEVPTPIATIAGKNGGNLKKEELLVEEAIFAELIDFDFDLKFDVTKFDVNVSGAGGYEKKYPGTGKRFSTEQKNLFKSLAVNSVIYIDNIEAKDGNGSIRPLSPISFKIK